MPLDFMAFPGEIRNMIYKELLVLPEPIKLRNAFSQKKSSSLNRHPSRSLTYRAWSEKNLERLNYVLSSEPEVNVKTDYQGKWMLDPYNPEGESFLDKQAQSGKSGAHAAISSGHRIFVQILRTSKVVHDEASSLLYGLNQFQFFHTSLHGLFQDGFEKEWNVLELFLRTIGEHNVNHMRHLMICYPYMLRKCDVYGGGEYEYSMEIQPCSLRCLGLMIRQCKSLDTLEMSIDTPFNSINPLKMLVESSDNWDADPIRKVALKLRKITSLKQILITTSTEHLPYWKTKDAMVKRGWIVSAKSNKEDPNYDDSWYDKSWGLELKNWGQNWHRHVVRVDSSDEDEAREYTEEQPWAHFDNEDKNYWDY
ncbi:hypothetical protein BT63DRAFT_467116 [Microthyrium microscopicum]|uniref:F-box domain-containing protein n=1 Tax=Microthyrium microscopicum TaxID=703497 RepID=A0A6A6UMX0_9PEZI|nr:hypothetical protein BT63DRAFT_467116 [Microthyrium microscopicum]